MQPMDAVLAGLDVVGLLVLLELRMNVPQLAEEIGKQYRNILPMGLMPAWAGGGRRG